MNVEAQPHDGAEPSLEGRVVDLSDPEVRRAAIEQAFDYRGDVTIHTTDGRCIAGYIFDRRVVGDEPCVRIMPTDPQEHSANRLAIPIARIERLVFTGQDTAAGKSWQTWLKTYVEKKTRGEAANLEPEPLGGEEERREKREERGER